MRRLFLKVSLALAFAACAFAAEAARRQTQEGAGRKCSRGYFHLVEGLPVNRVEFAGNTYTRDSVIRRRLRLEEERPFSVALLRKSIEGFNRLGLFERVTEDDVEWCVNEKTGALDLSVEFTEKPSARGKRK